MRVALDVSAVPPRLAGAGRYIAELARRLPTSDVDTTLVTRRDDTLRWHDWSPSSTIASVVPNARGSRLLYEAWLLGAGATAKSVDVWHAPHYTMPRRRSKPTVVTIHDLTFFTNPEWHERAKVPFFRRAISYAARHADVLVIVSEFTARQLDEQVPAHAPVVVATLGVDLERFSADSSGDAQLLRAHGLSAERPYIFFLGTFEPRKGIDVLLDAFDEIAGHDGDVQLWLAGQPGWGVKEIEAKISAHAALSRIRRLGFVDEAETSDPRERGVSGDLRLDLLHSPAGLSGQPQLDVAVVTRDLVERVEQDVDALTRLKGAQEEYVGSFSAEPVRAKQLRVTARIGAEAFQVDAERRHDDGGVRGNLFVQLPGGELTDDDEHVGVRGRVGDRSSKERHLRTFVPLRVREEREVVDRYDRRRGRSMRHRVVRRVPHVNLSLIHISEPTR